LEALLSFLTLVSQLFRQYLSAHYSSDQQSSPIPPYILNSAGAVEVTPIEVLTEQRQPFSKILVVLFFLNTDSRKIFTP